MITRILDRARAELFDLKLFKSSFHKGFNDGAHTVMKIVREEAKNGGWIPCSERLPDVETEVLIHAKRKFRDGSFKDIITTAMYEDGTVRENDSSWWWEDVDGEWDEEEDCLIIPEGWWENKHYNPDCILNNAVDDEVIEWMPLPSYQKGERA